MLDFLSVSHIMGGTDIENGERKSVKELRGPKMEVRTGQKCVTRAS
jgi:hypothetical protein